MRTILLFGCVALCCATGGRAAGAQTQLEMNQSAGADLESAEAKMNAAMTRLLALAADKPQSIAKLQRAQAAWRAFRDAHVAAYWPSDAPQSVYGSVHPMCVANELARLTEARAKELQSMLVREEGDVCACFWPN